MEISEALSKIRAIPDYPIPGILFQDITPLLSHAESFQRVIKEISAVSDSYDFVAGIEARGFILASAIAQFKNVGFVPIRKKGKLPHATFTRTYGLEYGTDELQIHRDALVAGSRVLLVDDVLATGGTIEAALDLLSDVGAKVSAVSVLIEISSLRGREKIQRHSPSVQVHSLISH